MKSSARIVACLLPLLLAGCVHKTNTANIQPLAPPIEDVQGPKPSEAPKDLPPPVVTIPSQPPAPDTSTQTPEPPKPPVHHKKPVSKPTQQASNENPGVSAIGQLSSGAPLDLRHQTLSSILSTESGFNGIHRSLSAQEQKTAAQIREFLKQAREALNSGDVDGANTLVAKAKVLLGELQEKQ